MIYAFKKGDTYQTLDEHINECLKTLKKIENSKLWSNDFNYKFVRRVVIFHDVGKVAFQKEYGDLSFVGHEFISAYVFWEVFEDELIGKDKLLYTFPIIFHHHAMRIKSGKSKGRLERLKDIQIIICENTLEELSKILKNFVESKYVSRTVDALRNINTSTVVDNICEMIDEIWRTFHGNFAKNALKLLLITIICDYEGSKNRGIQTSFGKVVEDFFKYSLLQRSII